MPKINQIIFPLCIFSSAFCLWSLFLVSCSFFYTRCFEDPLKKSLFPSDFRVFLILHLNLLLSFFFSFAFPFSFPFLLLLLLRFTEHSMLPSRTSLVQTRTTQRNLRFQGNLSQRRKSIDILIIIHGSKRSNSWCQLLCTQVVVLQCLQKFSSSLFTLEYLSVLPLDSLLSQQTLLTQERLEFSWELFPSTCNSTNWEKRYFYSIEWKAGNEKISSHDFVHRRETSLLTCSTDTEKLYHCHSRDREGRKSYKSWVRRTRKGSVMSLSKTESFNCIFNCICLFNEEIEFEIELNSNILCFPGSYW